MIILKDQFVSFSEWFYRLLINVLGYTHPVHPTQINMPIGLVTGALLLGIVALLFRRSSPRISARHCMVLALVFLFPTVLSGIMDWQHFYGGVWIFAVKAKIVLGIIFLVLLVWGIWASQRPERGRAMLLTYALAFCVSVALGYFGGDIVFGGRTPDSKKGNRAGQIVFLNNCSGCHPYGGNIITPKEPVIGSPLLKSFEPFLAWMRNPSPPMPPFPPGDIPDEQAHALYFYLSEIWGEHTHGPETPQPATPAPLEPSLPQAPSTPDSSEGTGSKENPFHSPSKSRQVSRGSDISSS